MARYLSPFVYRFLPSLLCATGYVIGANIEHWLGKGSAALLVGAGLIIFNMRLNAR